jgi:hypothetical protein
MSRYLLATLMTLGTTLAALPAFGQAATGEQSKNTTTLEVVRGTKLYKHAVNTMDRNDTDTYPNTNLVRPAWTPNERFYIVGNEIHRVPNNSDTMSYWTWFSPPTLNGQQMTPRLLTKCGNRLCLIFDADCEAWRIYSWDLVTQAWEMGPLFQMSACARDAIDDIYPNGDGFVVLFQARAGQPDPWKTWFTRFTPGGAARIGREIGTRTDWINRVAQSMAPNRFDGATFFVLDTIFTDSIVKRVRISDGQVVGSVFYARAGYFHHDLAYVQGGRKIVLIGTDWSTKYNLVSFDDQNLSIAQDKVFNF